MTSPTPPSLKRHTWYIESGNYIDGVQVRNGMFRIFIPKDQLLTFSDFCVDAYEAYGQAGDEA
ncbi:hypothetical protein [Brachybacterium alimentarium]|uniref:hypothetical protein n=1 Tax=Brachybacterium alimentarium TaxID=47845 RepID=UPI003FD4A6A8